MKDIKIIALALFSLSTLTGCGIYSSYQRSSETEQMVDTLYDYIEATNDTTNIATFEWRELFTDHKLQALIEMGLERNTDLNVAKLSVDKANATLRAARLALLPSLSAGAKGSVVSTGGNTTQNYELSLDASWEVDLFGKLRNAKEASKAALEQSVAYQQAVQTQLIASIAGSYYSLLTLDEQLEISEQTQVNWENNLKVLEAMKRAGRVNEVAVLQARANSISLSSQIVSLKESIAAMESSISLLLAMPTTHIERGTIIDVEFPTTLAVGVPIQLLTNRPDIRVAESQLAEAFYVTAESRSNLYPSITLSGSAGYTSDIDEMIYSAIGSLTQPLFNRGALKAQVAISEAQEEQALLQFNQAILDAGAEVNNALSSWQAAQERLLLGSEQIALLEKAVTRTELLMKHGSLDYLDVLTAQLSLLQTELSFSADKYNQTQAAITLYKALGGGER